ncbi:phosphoglycerate mutase family protein [Zunongwangia endophytica]|uniref:Phosphoglycerate mutase family protein n=1 Tax=Zunongwangia endophytica TaxID=1808945 RepID=A0ABV8HF68_9FLAO|nr:phosphoglycerate mutase family protein [Zunongwangia endophytica]MDN3593388.1 phosphoglycerate mutase family protein [Zunongwangia endophytica]
MTRSITLLVLMLTFLFSCQTTPGNKNDNSQNKSEKSTTYYFIRHAEKDTSDANNKNPELTAEGKQRAEQWKMIFTEADFDAIYSSDFIRTRETAQPTAESKNLSIEVYDHKNLNSEKFKKETLGKKVLVVGHTNTTPYFANRTLGYDHFEADIDESEHGKLFIVQVNPNAENTIQNLTFN